jgi:hypothetical protein
LSRTLGQGVPEHVRANLRQGDLEQHQRPVAGVATNALADELHRPMKGVQAVVEAGERGMELE